MHLSRLEIFGFKSFANKLDLRFDDGITAVVGPNGCGKTNIVDAIRWVLGEQRPRFLRGDRMEDVIFNGSERREPLGMAEVSLTIENTRGILPIEYNEVTVSRRLFRSGESDYLINRTACRLMDIENLLMDTGIGPHSYSTIEQGMVEAIISEDPQDRRRLFEEAAGITKYKARRRAALQRLSATEEDLLRIGDIIGEVERQTESLSRQVRKAERYQTYRKQVRDLEIRAARFRFSRLQQKAQPLLDESKTLKGTLEGLSAALRKKEAESEKLRLELLALEKELGEKDEHIRTLDRAIHRRGEEIAVLRERIGALKNLVERSKEEEQRTQARLAEARTERDTAEQNETQATQGLSELVRKAAIHEKELEQGDRSVEEKRGALEGKRREVTDLFSLHVRKSSEEERRKSQLNGSRIRLGELTKERRGLESELSQIHERQQKVEAGIAHLKEHLAAKQAERARLVEDLRDNEDRLRTLNRSRDSLEAERRASEEQLDFWRRMRETYEGYSESVRSLLLDSPLAEHIRGVIGDLIDVDEQFAPAIERALGPLLQALVVEDTPAVQRALKFLDHAHTGRTIFLPLDRISESSASQSVPTQERGNERKVPQVPGVIGLVEHLVRCEQDLVPIVRFLFKDTLMVDTLQHALSLSGRGDGSFDGVYSERSRTAQDKRWNAITLKGERVSFRGEIVGGAGKGERKELLLGRRRQIEDLERTLTEKSHQLEANLREIVLVQSTMEEQSATRSLLDEEIEKTGREVLLLDQRKAQGGFEAQRLHERSVSLDEEKETLKRSIARLKGEIVAGTQELLELEARKSLLESTIAREEKILRGEEAKRRDIGVVVHQLRVDIASTEEKTESLRRDLRRLKQAIEDYDRAKVRHQQEAEEAIRSIEDLQRRIETGDEAQQAASENLLALEKSRDTLDRRRLTLQQQSGEWEEELRKMRRNQEEVRSTLYDLDGKLSELRMEAKNLYARIQERYKMDVERMELLEDEDTFDLERTEREIQRLQERVERMGPVNLAALDEYRKEKERYEFLTRQRDDLVDARDTLKQTIVEINRRARKQFMETFEQVRRNFQDTFVRFFGGGQADLTLEEKDDPLEAEVQIAVRPLGKRLQHLNLLSGGEKALTAIALLFAIYQKKPGPFCILDEVDAALDDANVVRFVEVLEQFSTDTQFIIITHNKRTMEASDRLYGITMEEPGISQLVAVKFGDDGNAERAEVVG